MLPLSDTNCRVTPPPVTCSQLSNEGKAPKHIVAVNEARCTWCGLLQRVPAVESPLLLLAQVGAVLQQPMGDPALTDAWKAARHQITSQRFLHRAPSVDEHSSADRTGKGNTASPSLIKRCCIWESEFELYFKRQRVRPDSAAPDWLLSNAVMLVTLLCVTLINTCRKTKTTNPQCVQTHRCVLLRVDCSSSESHR